MAQCTTYFSPLKKTDKKKKQFDSTIKENKEAEKLFEYMNNFQRYANCFGIFINSKSQKHKKYRKKCKMKLMK